MVSKPKDKGGLGILNLTIQNEALLLKHLDKFYNKRNIPWVKLIWNAYYRDVVPYLARAKGSFWWKDVLSLHLQFRAIASCSSGSGNTISLWEDLINNKITQHQYPRLFSYAKDPTMSLQLAFQSEPLHSLFNLPMSGEAFNEFNLFSLEIESLRQNANNLDTWSYIWGSPLFTSHKYYKQTFSAIVPPCSLQWICKSKCIPRLN